jgi:hypothetical protein
LGYVFAVIGSFAELNGKVTNTPQIVGIPAGGELHSFLGRIHADRQVLEVIILRLGGAARTGLAMLTLQLRRFTVNSLEGASAIVTFLVSLLLKTTVLAAECIVNLAC